MVITCLVYDNFSVSTLFSFEGIRPLNMKVLVGQKPDQDILFWLEIPKIQLRKEIYQIDSFYNNVDYHIEILEESNLENKIFYLAAHSGYGANCYFNDLALLERGDFIWIFLENSRLDYVIEEIYFIEKDGYLEIYEEDRNGVVYLITCSLLYPEKQLIVKAEFIC